MKPEMCGWKRDVSTTDRSKTLIVHRRQVLANASELLSNLNTN